MKNKALSFLASIFLLSFASCTDEVQEMANEQSQTLKQIVMTTQDFQPEAGSRTIYEIEEVIKCTWADNDTVGIFPDKGAQAYFPMASGAGTKNATFDGEGWALKDGRTYGAYYPCIGKFYLDRNAVPVSYTGQIQTGNASMEHLGAYDYMVATPTVPEAGLAQFTFKHLSALVLMKITIPQPATLTSVKLVTDTKAFAEEGTVDIMAETLSITPVVSSKEFILDLQDIATTEANQVVTLYMMIPPTDLSEQTLKAVIMSDKGTQEIAFAGKNFKAGTAYTLSGKLESTDLGYKDGVVRMAEAGTMKQFLGDDWLNITSLKVVGPINGNDVLCLRQMFGASEFSDADKGKLASLDLSDAMIVEGGNYYYYYKFDSSYYNTSNDVIGEYMFYKCANLQDIVLPDNVTAISDNAFYECSSLASINIPAEVTSIGAAFYNCSSLKTVHITDLSAWCKIVFNHWTSTPLCYDADLYLNNQELTELVIPEEITEIKAYAFQNCSSLTSVTMGTGVTSIGNNAFDGCSSLTSIDIPAGVTSIGDSAFSGCSSLTSIDIPTGVTSIGGSAFSRCSSLTSIDIPVGVTSIGNSTFYKCSSLTSINIPAGITSIGNYAFMNCSYLSSIEIPAGVTSIGSDAFSGCSYLSSIDIPAGVTLIDSNTFRDCSSLTSISIPAGITTINNYAFYACSSLKSVHIADLSEWCKITFYGPTANPLCYKGKLYVNNQELTELAIPEEITEIKDYAFYNYYYLTSVTMGTSVTSIGDEVFSGCSSLTSITMGAGVTSIGNNAFYNCTSLQSAHISDLSAWCKIAFSSWASTPLCHDAKLYLNNQELTELVIPTDIKQIKNFTFYKCRGVEKLTIGEKVTSIGNQSFLYCAPLTQVYCYATTPPTINVSSTNSTFYGSGASRTLYVPAGCSSAYQSSNWASFFGTIEEME